MPSIVDDSLLVRAVVVTPRCGDPQAVVVTPRCGVPQAAVVTPRCGDPQAAVVRCPAGRRGRDTQPQWPTGMSPMTLGVSQTASPVSQPTQPTLSASQTARPMSQTGSCVFPMTLPASCFGAGYPPIMRAVSQTPNSQDPSIRFGIQSNPDGRGRSQLDEYRARYATTNPGSRTP
jgi:hypothetical protein